MDKLTAGAAESSWQGFCGAFAWREAARRLPSISITKNAAGPARNRFLRHFPLFRQIFHNLDHMVKPNFLNSFAAGAEAPKDFMLITAPSRPV